MDVAVDPPPADVPFRIAADVVNGFSAIEPARIRVSFENRSEMERTVGGGPIFPLSEIWCAEGPLVLIPSDERIRQYAFGTDEKIVPDAPVDGCWRTNLVRLTCNDVLRWRSLEGGECVRTEYAVLHYPESEIMRATMEEWFGPQSDTEECLPAGEYRFEESLLPELRTDTDWEEFTWGLTLTLE